VHARGDRVSRDQLPGLLTILALVGLAWVGMAVGWRRRARRQHTLPAPAALPAHLSAPLLSVEGLFVGTALTQAWLERVVPHGLGARAGAVLSVHPDGLVLERDGSPPLWVPQQDLLGVRRDTGLAGKVTETGGLVVWTWRLGPAVLDSGLRPRYAADAAPLVAAAAALVTEEVAE